MMFVLSFPRPGIEHTSARRQSPREVFYSSLDLEFEMENIGSYRPRKETADAFIHRAMLSPVAATA